MKYLNPWNKIEDKLRVAPLVQEFCAIYEILKCYYRI